MTAVAAPPVPVAGTLVARRYRIEGLLGEGSYGAVVAARDEREGCDVALKLLQSIDDESARRFFREARLASMLETPHVVRVFEVGAWQEQPFIVMERLVGEDLETKSNDGPLPVSEVTDCLLQVCEALAHAHGAGIVHRDIKTSNIFETRADDGSSLVKVLDFGVSKIDVGTAGLERLTRTAPRGGPRNADLHVSGAHPRSA
jgi:serine/threonine-protein kinase